MSSIRRASIACFLFPDASNKAPNTVESLGMNHLLDSTSPNIMSNAHAGTTSPSSGTSVPMEISPSNRNDIEEEHSIGVYEDEMDSTPTQNRSPNLSESTAPNVDAKIYVGAARRSVRDFEPRHEAFIKMMEIVRSHYTGPWTSVSKVPDTTKDLWFQEFQKLFYWNVSDH